MLRGSQFWTLTAAAGITLALVLVNMFLFQANRELQAQANSRAQYVQQSVAMEQLQRQIAQELANLALRTRDDQVRDLLAAEGFNVTFDARPAAQEATP
jgi:type VI protein secretion system component VasK